MPKLWVFFLTLLFTSFTFANIPTINHDTLDGYEPNEHIDWTAASQDVNTTGTGKFAAIQATDLTSGRVPYISTGGLFADSTNFTWDNTNQQFKADGVIYSTGTTGSTPVSGAGTRLMWIPAKAAFRAGSVTGTDWDNANIGRNTFVFGSDSLAQYPNCYVFGNSCDAYSTGDFLVGGSLSTAAEEGYSVLLGSTLSTQNTYTFIQGYNISSGGDHQACFGRSYSPIASDDSFCLGWGQLDYTFTDTAADFKDSNFTTTGYIKAGDLDINNETGGGIGIINCTRADGTFLITAAYGEISFNDENVATSGTFSAGAITGTSFIIGSNTLDANEWAYLDGQDQALKTTDDVSFGAITGISLTDGTATLSGGNLTGMGNITGTDVDISAGTGSYSSSGTLGAGATTLTGNLDIGAHTFTVNSIEVVGSDGEVNKNAVEDSSNWDAAYTHISSNGTDHTYIDQDLQTTATPQFAQLGIGAASSSNIGIKNAFSVSSTTAIGISDELINTSNSIAPAGYMYGLSFSASWQPSTGATGPARTWGTIMGGYSVVGITLDADEDHNFTMTNAYGYRNQFTLASATVGAAVAKMTNAYNFYALDPSINANSVITDLYAFYDAGMTAGNDNWGLYSASAKSACGTLYPVSDDTYYLGKNDDDSPAAWKGVIVKDTNDGKYYRIQVTNGAVEAIDLTD